MSRMEALFAAATAMAGALKGVGESDPNFVGLYATVVNDAKGWDQLILNLSTLAQLAEMRVEDEQDEVQP